MELGRARVGMGDGVHAALGDPDVFQARTEPLRAVPDAIAAIEDELRDVNQPDRHTRLLSEIALTLLRLEAHLTRPRWYHQLWAWIRSFWE